jgi:hypothetical protein
MLNLLIRLQHLWLELATLLHLRLKLLLHLRFELLKLGLLDLRLKLALMRLRLHLLTLLGLGLMTSAAGGMLRAPALGHGRVDRIDEKHRSGQRASEDVREDSDLC